VPAGHSPEPGSAFGGVWIQTSLAPSAFTSTTCPVGGVISGSYTSRSRVQTHASGSFGAGTSSRKAASSVGHGRVAPMSSGDWKSRPVCRS
jgi:hypothetical protein